MRTATVEEFPGYVFKSNGKVFKRMEDTTLAEVRGIKGTTSIPNEDGKLENFESDVVKGIVRRARGDYRSSRRTLGGTLSGYEVTRNGDIYLFRNPLIKLEHDDDFTILLESTTGEKILVNTIELQLTYFNESENETGLQFKLITHIPDGSVITLAARNSDGIDKFFITKSNARMVHPNVPDNVTLCGGNFTNYAYDAEDGVLWETNQGSIVDPYYRTSDKDESKFFMVRYWAGSNHRYQNDVIDLETIVSGDVDSNNND